MHKKQYKYVSREWKNGRWHYYYVAPGTKTNKDGSISLDPKGGAKKVYLKNRRAANEHEERETRFAAEEKARKERVAKYEAERKDEIAAQEKAAKKAKERKMKGKNKVLKWLYKKGLYNPG